MSKSSYLEDEILDHILSEGVRAFTSPPTLFLALGTAAGEATFTELETPGANGYDRQALTFAAASAGSAASSDAQSFGPATSDWANATVFAIYDASTAGNVLYYGTLTAARDAAVDDTIEFAIGAITVTED